MSVDKFKKPLVWVKHWSQHQVLVPAALHLYLPSP